MEDLPRFIYIWYDEEKVTDYIKETYPSIEVIHFNTKNSVKKDYSGLYTTKEYKLADLMFEKFKDSLEKRTMYQVDRNYKITKEEMDDMDIAGSRYPSFGSHDEAKQYCVDSLKEDIKKLESRITDYEDSIKAYKSTLRKKNTLLKKFQKEEK